MTPQRAWPGSEPVDRRSFLRTLGVLGLGSLAVTGCGTVAFGQSSGGQTVNFWNLFTGGDGQRMIQMQAAFQKAHPAIAVNAVTLTWGLPYYSKLAMSIVAGRAPDVAILHMSRLPSFAPANLLEPIDEGMLKQYGITSDHFEPSIWRKAHSNGKLYAIPLDVHPLVMYYNTKICKQAGLLDGSGRLKPIQGTSGLLDAFEKAKKVTGAFGVSIDAQDVQPWRLFYTLYSQAGGTLDLQNSSSLLTEATAAKAAAFLEEMTQRRKLAPPNLDYPGSVALFGAGRAGFFWNGTWEVTTFQTTKMPFDVALTPQIFRNKQTWSDSHSFVIPRGSASDPKRLHTTLTFISEMLKRSATWAMGGNIPAYRPVLESKAFKKLLPQSHYTAEEQHVHYDPPAWYAGAAGRLETDAGSAFQGVLSGQMSPTKGYQQFRSALEQMASAPRPF
jgi:multiple sugar transport system substrate-binding protein